MRNVKSVLIGTFFTIVPRRKASTEFEVVNVTLVALPVSNPTKVMVTDNLYAECFIRKTLTSPSRARADGLGSRHSDTGGGTGLGG